MIQKRFFSRHFSYLTIFFPAYFLVAFLCHTILWSWHSSQSKTVSPTRKRYPICISSFPQVLFRKFAVFFNNWIICCVFLPSTWSPERGKQGVGISPEKKKSISSVLWKSLESLHNFFSSCFIGHFLWGFDLAERRSKTFFCRYHELSCCKREINSRFLLFFKPLGQEEQKRILPIN